MNNTQKMVSRFFLFFALLFALAFATRATTITLSAAQIPNVQAGAGTYELRVWLDRTLVDSAGIVWPVGAVDSPSNYKSVTCALASTTVTCNTFALASTVDAQEGNLAKYTAKLYRNNAPLLLYNKPFALPASLGSSVTWEQIWRYNNTVPNRVLDNEYYTKNQVNALYTGSIFSNPATTLTRGVGKISVGAADPVFVETTDPRVPIQGENDALVGTSGTPSSTNKYVTNADPRIQSGTATPFVNPMASPYNAAGDGVADDTAEVQAAWDALDYTKGGTIVFPPGSIYKLSSPIIPARVQQFGVYSNVTVIASGATFILTSAATSGVYYHPASQTVNNNVIYGRISWIGGSFIATSRTAGQVGIDVSSCEGCRFQDIDFKNMNGIHLRTAYRTIVENCNVQVDNEYGFKVEGGDWSGATAANSPSNGTVIRNSRVIPGSGSLVNFWFVNADVSGLEHSISDAPDALYPNSGSPVNEVVFDNSAYSLGQTNWVREYYSERPTIPTTAVIGAILNGGTLTLDLIRRYDDATGVVYVDATGSTSNSTIKLRDWPRIDASPTPRFKTATGVQWRMDGVGEGATQSFINAAWWVGGTVGNVSQWGKNGIIANGGPSVIPAFQLGRYSSGASEFSFALSRGTNDWFLGAASGDGVFRFMDKTKKVIFGLGDGSNADEVGVFALDGNTTANETRFMLYDITAGTLKRVGRGAADSCGTGFRCVRIPN